MSLKELTEKLYPTFLAAFKETAVDSCRLFLSATNMSERALIRNATADTPEEAWSKALQSLEEVLSDKADEVSILRADWVRSRESTTWADCLEQIQAKRRNWFLRGIALDKEYRLAFTSQELDANLILYQPDKENTQGAFQPDKADSYCRRRFNCAFPKLSESNEVELFETNGVFIQDGMSAPLSITGKGITGTHRDIPANDTAIFLQTALESTDFLVRQCEADGKFVYGLNPCDDTVISGYNTHRHFGTLYSMAEAYAVCDDDKKADLGAAIERGLEYAIRELLVYRRSSDGKNAAYFKEGRVTTVGITGLALLAFTKWSEVSGTQKYFPLMRDLANGLIILQKSDGTFPQSLNIKDFTVRKDFIISFYDGEALFGMLRLYALTKDENVLEFVERATRHFIAVKYQQYHDHWIQYTMNELTIWRPEKDYFKFGLANIAEYLIKIYKSLGHAPTQLEMIMAAENMIRRMKSLPEMKDLLKNVNENTLYSAINRRAARLMNGFFFPEVAMFFQNPARLLGGFFARTDAFRTRIDDSQHTISGLLAYDRYLKGASVNAVPKPIKVSRASTIKTIKAPVVPPKIQPIKTAQTNRTIISAGSVRMTIEAEPSEPIKILSDQPQPVIIEAAQKKNSPLRVGVLRKSKSSSWSPDSPMFTMFYAAKNFDIELLLFTPQDIDFENRTVNAVTLEGTKQIQKTVPLPKIIDNPASIFGGEYGKQLKTLDGDYFFTRHAEHMSKPNVYNMLLKDGRYKDLLIDTVTLESFVHFLTLLGQYGNDVIVKPSGSNEGKGVARITFDGEQYVVNLKTDKVTLKTVDDLRKFYDENFSSVRYVLQPYITSRTHLGNPFDIRIHTRRGAGGKFKVFPYPRIGNENGVVSNVGSGGYTMKFDVFLKAEFGNDWKMLYDKIMTLGNDFPEYYQTFFKSRLFDVGIDVGIQKRGDTYELKIFEVNTYLGGSFVRVEDAVTRFEYFHYVAQNLLKQEPALNQPQKNPDGLLTIGILRGALNGKVQPFWDKKNHYYPMFSQAKDAGIALFYFTMNDIDFENETVSALTFENGSQVRKLIPWPKIIDNDQRYFRDETANFMERLRERCYLIRPIRAAGKQKFYNMLSQDGRFNEFLITTHTVKDFKNFMTLLEQYHNEVIMKPGNGVGGSGVVKVWKEDNHYLATFKNQTVAIKDRDELLKFYNEHFTKRTYLLQPYINSRTRQNKPFDIRLHARRGAEGKFQTFFYPRIGNADGVISNIVAGGNTMDFEEFIQTEFGDDRQIVLDKLQYLGKNFPDYYQSFFDGTIFDIGIDIGIQKRGDTYELKLFEAYIQPGFTKIPEEVARTNFDYWHYIAKKLGIGS